MQMLNVACGGTIDQHLPDRLEGSIRHREVPGTFSDHEVTIDPDSLAARATGAERAAVKSHHHQGIAELGEGLVVSARDADGVVEAIEMPGEPFVLAVQWHPEERLDDLRVFAGLVEAARAYAVVPAGGNAVTGENGRSPR